MGSHYSCKKCGQFYELCQCPVDDVDVNEPVMYVVDDQFKVMTTKKFIALHGLLNYFKLEKYGTEKEAEKARTKLIEKKIKALTEEITDLRALLKKIK